MTSFLLVVLAASLLTIQIHGYPTGAPSTYCKGPVTPHHDDHKPQTSKSPLTKFETKWNPDNETISIRIESDKPIKGVYVQGRKMNGDEPIGTFINLPSETHLNKCSTGDGVTHNAPQKWTKLQLTWKKPKEVKSLEKIQFWATIVIDFTNFWVVKSIK